MCLPAPLVVYCYATLESYKLYLVGLMGSGVWGGISTATLREEGVKEGGGRGEAFVGGLSREEDCFRLPLSYLSVCLEGKLGVTSTPMR